LPGAEQRRHGFTLVEVLAALALMAAVLPVVVRGMGLASMGGEVAQRKAIAMRVAERVLNETIVTGRWNMSSQQSSEQVGNLQLKYTVRNEPWSSLSSAVGINTANGLNQSFVNQNNLHVISVDVSYPVRGQTFAVHLSTIADVSVQLNANPPPDK
jgi:prepilin-type N-terminal cleavage/methylation domain-containing protein